MAIMPCTDDMNIPDSENISHNHFDEPSHDHSQNDKDGCTAFCLCQCCGISITIPSLNNYSDLNEPILNSFSFHFSFLYSFDYSNGVWHPPTHS